MPRGRPRKPRAVKKLQGTLQPCREPKHEAEPVVEIPDMPDFLKAESVEEWNRIVGYLYNLGLLTQIDRSSLAAYCEAFGLWCACQRKIAQTGLLIKAPSGYPILNPLLSISRKAVDQMKAFAVEFGMTPASRTRIEAKPPVKKSDAKGKPDKTKVVGFFE